MRNVYAVRKRTRFVRHRDGAALSARAGHGKRAVPDRRGAALALAGHGIAGQIIARAQGVEREHRLRLPAGEPVVVDEISVPVCELYKRRHYIVRTGIRLRFGKSRVLALRFQQPDGEALAVRLVHRHHRTGGVERADGVPVPAREHELGGEDVILRRGVIVEPHLRHVRGGKRELRLARGVAALRRPHGAVRQLPSGKVLRVEQPEVRKLRAAAGRYAHRRAVQKRAGASLPEHLIAVDDARRNAPEHLAFVFS